MKGTAVQQQPSRAGGNAATTKEAIGSRKLARRVPTPGPKVKVPSRLASARTGDTRSPLASVAVNSVNGAQPFEQPKEKEVAVRRRTATGAKKPSTPYPSSTGRREGLAAAGRSPGWTPSATHSTVTHPDPATAATPKQRLDFVAEETSPATETHSHGAVSPPPASVATTTIHEAATAAAEEEDESAVAAKCKVLEEKYPRFCEWQKESLREKEELRLRLAASEMDKAQLTSQLSKQTAISKMLMGAAKRQKAAAGGADTSGLSSSTLSGGANQSLSGYSQSELVASLLQEDDEAAEGELRHFSPTEQNALLRDIKGLTREYEVMQQLLQILKESLTEMGTEKEALEARLNLRTQLIAELFQQSTGPDFAARVAGLVGTIKAKMEAQDQLCRGAAGADESLASIDQSFIVDRFQSLVADSADLSVRGAMAGGALDESQRATPRPASAARRSLCVLCRQAVSNETGRAVHPVGLVHDKCFKCSLFGCGADLGPGNFAIRDSQLFCAKHADVSPSVAAKLCGV
eukprot:m.29911 g.29911  ORF g.29911 m.29911 type:complete len:521 (-) comp6741_c0_seq1:1936-3498(-)